MGNKWKRWNPRRHFTFKLQSKNSNDASAAVFQVNQECKFIHWKLQWNKEREREKESQREAERGRERHRQTQKNGRHNFNSESWLHAGISHTSTHQLIIRIVPRIPGQISEAQPKIRLKNYFSTEIIEIIEIIDTRRAETTGFDHRITFQISFKVKWQS